MTQDAVDGRTLRHAHRRPELLRAVREYVLDHGLADLSLRGVAREVGVTHATLLRHFSSRAELVQEVVESIRQDFLADWRADEALQKATTTVQLVQRAWERLCEPSEQRQFLLLFETVALAARDPDLLTPHLARAIVQDWQTPVEQALRRDGWPDHDAQALSALVVAQVRGLQLELAMASDKRRIDHALTLALSLLER